MKRLLYCDSYIRVTAVTDAGKSANDNTLDF